MTNNRGTAQNIRNMKKMGVIYILQYRVPHTKTRVSLSHQHFEAGVAAKVILKLHVYMYRVQSVVNFTSWTICGQ